MIRHIVMWNYKDGFTDEQNELNAKKVKSEIEGLVDLIGGVKSLRVIISPLASSSRDIMLDSLFESAEALEAYQTHPEHVRVSGFVGSVTKDRACVDYYE